MTSRWLRGLNPKQREAVKTVDGPLLVLAGAGSGKTRVITHRIAYMIEQGVPADQILAVTFTNKAAAEMRERLKAMVGRVVEKVTLRTFHALGLSMLREEAAHRHRAGRFVIFDQGDQMACLREIAGRLRMDRSFDLGAVASRISAYKNAFISPEAMEASEDPYEQATQAFYPAYLEMLEAQAAVDFDDLVCKPTQMMERSKACRRRWSDRFQRVLVDEYQDTNSAQLRMLRAIAGEHMNLCVVGDDDQSIYGWRGAEVKNILQFATDFPGGRSVFLQRNYRSVAKVLDLANAVIEANPDRHPKRLVATREQGPTVRLVVSEDGEKEAAWVADLIRDRVDAGGCPLDGVAILYRSNKLARAFEAALRARDLSYRVLGGRSFFDRKEVKDLMAYLRLAIHPVDSLSLRRIINVPARGIGAQTVAKLAAWAEQRNLPLSKAVEQAGQVLGEGDRVLPAVRRFSELMVGHRKSLRKGPLVGAVRSLLDQIGLHQSVIKSSNTGDAAEKRWAGVEDFLIGLEGYEKSAAKPSLREYLHQLSLNELDGDKDKEDEGRGLITLSSLHGAKGLEFSLVFLVGAEEGYLPHARVMNPSISDVDVGDLAEERRICYVGITRAKDELIITRAASRVVHGKARERVVSRYLADLDESLIEVEDQTAPVDESTALEHLSRIRAMLNK